MTSKSQTLTADNEEKVDRGSRRNQTNDNPSSDHVRV